MADTFTEFVNSTTKTYTDLKEGIPLVTTSAGQTAVVKDVAITMPNASKLNLFAGGFLTQQFSAGGGRTILSGTEIIKPSSSLTMKIAPEHELLGTSVISLNGGYYYDVRPAAPLSPLAIGGTLGIAKTTVTAGIQVSGMDYQFCDKGANGDFYYCTQASFGAQMVLYRRAGGVSGPETTVHSTFGIIVCADDRYIYGVTSDTSIRIYDKQTNAIVQTCTVSNLSGISMYSSCACLDGVMVIRANTNLPTKSIDLSTLPSTAAAVDISTLTGSPSQRSFIAIGKDSGGNYVCFVGAPTAASNSFQTIRRVAGAWASPSDMVASSPVPMMNNSGNGFWRTANPRYIGIYYNSTSIYLFDCDDRDAVPTKRLTFPTTTFRMGAVCFPMEPSIANADFGPIGVRATGVLTT